MKKNSNQKGFTLVEILIVVVIIAILAALILPRLLSQPERAIIAEAQQMLGVLNRGQTTNMDVNGTTSFVAFNCSTVATCASPAEIGVDLSKNTGGKFGYQCFAAAGANPNSCTAKRLDVPTGSAFSNATINLTSANVFSCSPKYKILNELDPSKGCTV